MDGDDGAVDFQGQLVLFFEPFYFDFWSSVEPLAAATDF
jgi:hypothetical protein